MTDEETLAPLLDIIRRAEAEVKRRLAAEREAAGDLLTETEWRATDLSTTAHVEGQRAGEAQRQSAQAETDRLAKAVLVQARTQADSLQRCAERQMAAAVARAVEVVIGVDHEA